MNAIENSESPVFRSIMNRCDREHLIRTMAEKERALIAEYYDEDGNLLHRPRTRQRARLASCVASIQEYEASQIHALPDEVLLLVFSRMQSAELLPLRLVCPRWNQLILDPAVWRWRKISDESPFDDWRTASSILYNAPTLGTVELPDCRFSEGAKRLMAALLEGRCQVRSLSCLLVLRVREDVHPALFRRLQPCLVDLDVQLARSSYVSSTGMVAIKRHLASMLESLDNSPLQRLALRSYGLHSFDLTLEDFEFKKLEALQEVSLDGRVLALDLQRNLVTLTRSTLRRVTCSSDLLPSLAQCPNLVAVTVTRYSGLDALYDLKALESVTLNIDRLHDIRFVDSYLSAARKGCRLPRSVGVVGDTSVNFLLGLQEANLRKITTLRLNLNSYEIGAIACTLKCLPSLQVLHIPSCTISSPSWEAVNLGTLNEVVLYGYVRSRSEAVTTIKARWPQVTCRLFPLIGSRHRDFLLL